MEDSEINKRPNTTKKDQHLRSTKSVTGYAIHATDGEIGKVVDYIVEKKKIPISFPLFIENLCKKGNFRIIF